MIEVHPVHISSVSASPYLPDIHPQPDYFPYCNGGFLSTHSVLSTDERRAVRLSSSTSPRRYWLLQGWMRFTLTPLTTNFPPRHLSPLLSTDLSSLCPLR